MTEKKTKSLLTFKQCYHCDTKNSPESNLCSHCGRSLDLKATMDLEKIRKELNIEITNLISIDPNVNCMLQENLCVGVILTPLFLDIFGYYRVKLLICKGDVETPYSYCVLSFIDGKVNSIDNFCF